MINVSSKFKRLLYSGESNLIVDATITLANNTVLNVSNPQIMSGGLEIDDAVGSDGDFDCIGSTIVNGCDLILYNNNEIYSDYDFINAEVNIAVKLQTDTTIINGVETPVYESVQKGIYTVDEATFSSMSVTLKLLDNMCQFDRPYDSYGIYRSNTTIYDIVIDACTKCGVTPASSMTNMPNKTFVVAGKPKDDTTYREVIGWCAAIAGCFARCNPDGELEFVWFDIAGFTSDESIDGGIFDNGTPYYISGDNVNGGVFNPWNDPSNIDDGEFTNIHSAHYISALTAQNIGIDDVVITDVQVAYEVETNNKVETKYYPTTITNDSYVISIGSIPFISATNVQSFYNFLNSRLVGLTFRTCDVTHAIHDPTIEAGDIAWLWDAKGVRHRILITRVTFPISGAQTIVCGAKTPARNSATQLTALAKANARSNRRLNEEKSIRQQLEENFNSFVTNSTGLYLHQVTDASGAVTIYGHDKQYLVESKKVLKISNGAIAMTDDYKGTDAATSWYGFQFNGTWLANIISTVNLFFDHAHGGTLELGGVSNGNGNLKLYDNSGEQIGSFDNTGLKLYNKLYSEGVPGQYEVRLQSGTLAFYYENVYIGEFVSTYIVGNVNKRGISMHLSEDGDFMSWSVYNTFTQNYDIKLSYLKHANSTGLENDEGLADTFRVNCDFDMAGHRIVDPCWKFRTHENNTYSYTRYTGVSGTYYISGANGYKDVLMTFKRGILVHSEDLN